MTSADEVTLIPGLVEGLPSCLLALPPQSGPHTPLMISVHGVTCQPIEHLLAFAPLASRAGAALLVPYFSETQFRRLPMRVWVGARDTQADWHLRADPIIGARQGVDRIARARHWVDAVEAGARSSGVVSDIELEILPLVGHSFMRCVERGDMAKKVVAFFFGAFGDGANEQANCAP